MRLVVLVDKIDNDFNHHVFFFSPAFGNHESEGDERVICDALVSVRGIENAIAVHKPKEERGGDTFVAIGEGVILGDEIEEHGAFSSTLG